MSAFLTALPLFVLFLSVVIESDFVLLILFIVSSCIAGTVLFNSEDPKANPQDALFILCFLGSVLCIVQSGKYGKFNMEAAFVLYTSVVAIASSMKKMKK